MHSASHREVAHRKLNIVICSSQVFVSSSNFCSTPCSLSEPHHSCAVTCDKSHQCRNAPSLLSLQNGGLDTEKDYPYTAVESSVGCDAQRKNRHVVTIDGYQEVPVGDEAALLKAVAHQPVAVAVQADSIPFQLYAGECPLRCRYGICTCTC